MASLPETMRGWQYSTIKNGLENSLTLRSDLPIPPLSTRADVAELLIESLSVSLNPADYKIPELPPLLRRAVIRTPATPGQDFCGRVVRTTPAAAPDFSPGDIVFGRFDRLQHGTLATYFPASVASCTKLPPPPPSAKHEITPDELSCLGVAGLTAYQSIAPHVTRGDKIFINGGAGGCGTLGIQIAKALGCHVTVSCSSAKRELCARLGADEVIDYTKGNLLEELKAKGKVFALCVDNVGFPAELYKAADEFMIPGRKFLQIGGGFDRAMIGATVGRVFWPGFLGGGRTSFALFMLKGKEGSEELVRWVREGEIEVVIEEVFEFEKLREAFEKLKSGKCYGKLVVRVGK